MLIKINNGLNVINDTQQKTPTATSRVDTKDTPARTKPVILNYICSKYSSQIWIEKFHHMS